MLLLFLRLPENVGVHLFGLGFRAVRDRRHWRGRHVSANAEGFDDPARLRYMMEAYMCAHLVTVNIRQLATFHVWSANVMLGWTGTRSLYSTSAESTNPLQSNPSGFGIRHECPSRNLKPSIRPHP